MRVCILSDTHGRLAEPIAEQVRRCDVAVHAGDIGSAAVLDALEPRSGEVVAVLGNNDLVRKWPAADLARLEALPARAELALPGGLLRVEHGHRVGPVAERHARLRRRHPQARAIVYGHSRTFGGPSCLLLRAGKRTWRVEALRFER